MHDPQTDTENADKHKFLDEIEKPTLKDFTSAAEGKRKRKQKRCRKVSGEKKIWILPIGRISDKEKWQALTNADHLLQHEDESHVGDESKLSLLFTSTLDRRKKTKRTKVLRSGENKFTVRPNGRIWNEAEW